MRILYLHQHVSLRSGTSGGRPFEFSRYLVGKGHQVTLLCGEYEHFGLAMPPGEDTARVELEGIDLRVLRVPYGQKMGFRRRILSFFSYAFGAIREIRKLADVDVVFASSTPLTVAIPGMLAARRLRCPFVFEIRDLWPEVPIRLGVLRNPVVIALARFLERMAYRKARAIVALSPGMRDWLLEQGIAAAKIRVISNASDVEILRRPPEEGVKWRADNASVGGRPLAVYAGSLGMVNDLGYVIRVASELRKIGSQAVILLVGRGSERERLEAVAREEGVLGVNLHFLGTVARQELGRVLSAATVLVSSFCDCPAMGTNSANKTFDAFAAGKPLVINYGGWQADLLRETGAGAVLSRDPAAAARELDALLRDQEWLARAAAASAALGEGRFNRVRLAGELESLLREVGAGPK